MDARPLLYLCLTTLAACQNVGNPLLTATDFPSYDNAGKPDLTVDVRRLASRMSITENYFSPEGCALQEGAVGAAGKRRLLRFDTVVFNAGDGDLVVGDRSVPDNAYAKLFEYAPCHGHYHIQDFSQYELLRAEDRSLVVVGRKQGFCFRDNEDYRGEGSGRYGCGYQGITSGWADVYGAELDGQWLDITGVPPGDYILRISINAMGSFDEGEDRYPDVAETPVHIPPQQTAALPTLLSQP